LGFTIVKNWKVTTSNTLLYSKILYDQGEDLSLWTWQRGNRTKKVIKAITIEPRTSLNCKERLLKIAKNWPLPPSPQNVRTGQPPLVHADTP